MVAKPEMTITHDTNKLSVITENTYATQSNLFANNITFKSANDMTQEGTNVYAENKLTYDIGNDLTIKASKDTMTSERKSEHLSGGVSVGNNAVQVSASAGQSSERMRAASYANSESIAKDIVMNVGNNAVLSGANVHASNDLTANIGNNLTVESLQDTYYAKGNSWDANVSVGIGMAGMGNFLGGSESNAGNKSIGAGFNVGNSYTDSAWVGEQTTLTSANKANITVGNKTTVTGAVIGSESNNLTLGTKELEYSDLKDKEVSRSKGFGIQTSIGTTKTSQQETNLAPQGSTTLSLKNVGNEKERVNKATIGKGTIIIDGNVIANGSEELQGLNRDLSKTQTETKERITNALDGSVTVDNRVFTSAGRASIAGDFKNIGENLEQIGKGLTDNIVVQSIKNAITDENTSLYQAVKDYVKDDKIMEEIQKDKNLTEKLNGLTNYSAEEVQQILQEVADIAGKYGGFSGNVELFNEGLNNEGYAYKDAEKSTIGFNTEKNDLTKSGGVINTTFHETTDFDRHTGNEQTAINRGNTAEGIWDLKNFGNENTNILTSGAWNEKNVGSALFTTGNNNVGTNLRNVQDGIGQMAGYGTGSILPTSIGNNTGLGTLITVPPKINPEDYIETIPIADPRPTVLKDPIPEKNPEGFVETVPVSDPSPTVLADPIPEQNPDDYILKADANRPSWRESEKDVAVEYPDYEEQKSFKDGIKVSPKTKGSSKPDLYGDNNSIEVKNYNLEKKQGENNLVNNVTKQINERINNLPEGAQQNIIIDIRGQKVSEKTKQDIVDKIKNKSNIDVNIEFKIK